MYGGGYNNGNYGGGYHTSYSCDGSIFILILIVLVAIVIGILFARYVGKKAESNYHSYGLWAVLGFLFGFGAVIAIHTAIRAEDEGHSFTLWAVLGFLFGLVAYLALHIAIVAEDEGHNFTFWALLGFFLNVNALIMLEVGLIAERKAYDFTSYCIIGSVFGLIGLIIACILPKAVTEKVASKNISKPQVQQPMPKPKSEESPFLKSVSTSNNTTATGTVWYCEYCGTTNYVGVDTCRHCYKARKK